MTFQEAVKKVALEVAIVVSQKQHDYGHANITTTGLQGLAVRLTDKAARLRNLTNGVTPTNESLRDTFVDTAGYGLIGLMLLDDTFENELAGEENGHKRNIN